VLAAREHVAQEWLIQPRGADRSGVAADERLEDLEARAPRRAKAAALDASGDRRGLAWLERGDRLEAAAVFVADRESIQEIFDREQADALEIRRAARADPLQELERRREQIAVS